MGIRRSAFCSVLHSATSSRGRTWRSAMRAVMRSTSLLPLSWPRKALHGPAPRSPRSVAMASSRAVACARSRRGSSSQHLSSAAAHAGHAGVEQGEQRGGIFAAQGLHQLQVAPGGHGQVDQRVAALHAQVAGRATARGPGCARHRPAARRRRRGRGAGRRRSRRSRLAACSCSSSLRWPRALSNCHSGRWLTVRLRAAAFSAISAARRRA